MSEIGKQLQVVSNNPPERQSSNEEHTNGNFSKADAASFRKSGRAAGEDSCISGALAGTEACARVAVAMELINQEPFLEAVRAINRIHEQCQQLSSEVCPAASRAGARSLPLPCFPMQRHHCSRPASGQTQTLNFGFHSPNMQGALCRQRSAVVQAECTQAEFPADQQAVANGRSYKQLANSSIPVLQNDSASFQLSCDAAGSAQGPIPAAERFTDVPLGAFQSVVLGLIPDSILTSLCILVAGVAGGWLITRMVNMHCTRCCGAHKAQRSVSSLLREQAYTNVFGNVVSCFARKRH